MDLVTSVDFPADSECDLRPQGDGGGTSAVSGSGLMLCMSRLCKRNKCLINNL